MLRKIISALVILALAACTSLLPDGKQATATHWESFQAAKTSFDRIEPYRTSLQGLHDLGFDPAHTPNVQILNYSQVVKRVLPTNTISSDPLPKGMRECYTAEERCFGYLLEQDRIQRQRVGNFFTDFLNFQRDVEITGWRFSALIVVIDDQVVFKQWSGQPNVHETETNHNPLGPLQGAGSSLGR